MHWAAQSPGSRFAHPGYESRAEWLNGAKATALMMGLAMAQPVLTGNYRSPRNRACCSEFLRGWRREWDSNPRYGFPYTRFPSVRLQPLGHPSRDARAREAHDATASRGTRAGAL